RPTSLLRTMVSATDHLLNISSSRFGKRRIGRCYFFVSRISCGGHPRCGPFFERGGWLKALRGFFWGWMFIFFTCWFCGAIVGLKYRGLRKEDIHLHSVDEYFQINALVENLPDGEDHETHHQERGSEKTGAQARYTNQALKRLVEERAAPPVETSVK